VPERLPIGTTPPSIEILRALDELLPGVIADGVIDVQRIAEAVGLPASGSKDEKERFGLMWAGRKESIQALQTPSYVTLSPDMVNSRNWNNAKNVFIEGDNLEVLKILQKSYNDQVKLIYIDPPYNTSSDFVYQDDFSTPLDQYLAVTGQVNSEGNRLVANVETSGRKSSNWLSMMFPRLFLARNLLTEDGLILIHIDEHEQANLQLLLDEIFGKENSLGLIVWDKRNPKGDSGGISSQHEYILAYARNSAKFLENQGFSIVKPSAQIMLDKAAELIKQVGTSTIPEAVSAAIKKYGIKVSNISEITKIKTLDAARIEYREWLGKQPFSGGELAYNQIDENGDVFQSVSMAWPNKKVPPADYLVPLIHPVTKKPCAMPERGWRNPTETMRRLNENGEIAYGKDEKTQPRRVYKLKQYMSAPFSSVMPYGGSDDALLAKMDIPFDTPKPVEVARQLISSCTKNSDIVLDFFAGSGTSAHATVMQNLTDGGDRRFILVNIDEETAENSEAKKRGFRSVSEITRKRIQAVLDDQDSEVSIGLRCLKLEASNFLSASNQKDVENLELFVSTLKSESKSDAIASEIFLKSGVRLDAAWEVVKISDGELFLSEAVGVVISRAVTNETINEVLEISRIQTWIFLEDAFAGRDDVKANAFFLFRQSNIAMRTI